MKKNVPQSTEGLTLLGVTKNVPSRKLETFDSNSSTAVVEFFTKEFTANCAVTAQPDFYTLRIRYKPNAKYIESKSLKMYLWSYRDTNAFIETLVRMIEDDIIAAAHPEWIFVELEMSPRGGISMKCSIAHKYDPVLDFYNPIELGPKGGR